MARLPKITVHDWTQDGPHYTIHHLLAGWRNRSARRGGAGDELVESDGDPHDGPAAFLALTRRDDEVWVFNKGHVYELELLIDGEAHSALVDAREDYYQQKFTHELQLLGHSALDPEAVAELEDEQVPEPGNMVPIDLGYVSDGAESQEPDPNQLDLDDAELELLTAPSEGDDEDADGGDGDLATDEEE